MSTPTVFPACAGMSPADFIRFAPTKSVPRMRGDEPQPTTEEHDSPKCSPHARG